MSDNIIKKCLHLHDLLTVNAVYKLVRILVKLLHLNFDENISE